MKFFRHLFLIFLPAFLLAPQAQALLGSSCVSLSEESTYRLADVPDEAWDYYSYQTRLAGEAPLNLMGLTCKDLRAIDQTAKIVGLTIKATYAAVGAKAVLAGEIAAVVGTPAVIGVSVIGAFGMITYYLVMDRSLEDCRAYDEEQMRQQILQELEARYGLKPVQKTPLQYTN